ncbi:MAG: FAD binding domain-containing protein [Candidatus Eisenbacteria bacterium]|uniref:FAD binding domain-containing protein n=1 Tax=Eiseniibacteriota bacterium TaxID=2212470 RepID=A0A933SA54_UNCEI|nr:FAD binding domain-containing protein [Candidatus Eisenbacteria bacterium]
MLTLPAFAWSRPQSVEDALAVLAAHPGECLIVAGGTDAVPNLKHRLHEPRRLVHLGGIGELRGIRAGDAGLEVGALVTLTELASHPHVREHFPGVVTAAAHVASPQIRNMGTVGGNLCLDTRCTYYNQTFFWREALGFCLKKDGTRCHVVPQGKRCVAAHSSDVAPVWIALGAEVEIASRDADGAVSRRSIPVEAFFVGDGVHNNVLAPGELVTRVLVPGAAYGLRTSYRKLRPRAAIDFPMLSVAVAVRGDAARIEELRVVVSALGAKPRTLGGLDAIVAGRAHDAALAEAVGAVAHKQCHPLSNVPYDTDWRHDMVPVFVKRALADALGVPA